MLGVVSETAIWQYMWYGDSPFQIYNDVDRAFSSPSTLFEVGMVVDPAQHIYTSRIRALNWPFSSIELEGIRSSDFPPHVMNVAKEGIYR